MVFSLFDFISLSVHYHFGSTPLLHSFPLHLFIQIKNISLIVSSIVAVYSVHMSGLTDIHLAIWFPARCWLFKESQQFALVFISSFTHQLSLQYVYSLTLPCKIKTRSRQNPLLWYHSLLKRTLPSGWNLRQRLMVIPNERSVPWYSRATYF